MKKYAVLIFDMTANTTSHGYYGKGDYSWARESLNGGASDIPYFDTKEEAEAVAKEFYEYIITHGLEWAHVGVETIEF